MGQPNENSIGTKAEGASSGNSSNLADQDIQRFASGLYRFDSDKIYGTFERSELAALPKSLFYDGATARETYRGLFAYYVLGKNSQGGRARYHISEKTEELSKITPNYSRNPTAKQIIETVAGPTQSGIPAFLDPASPFRGQIF